VPSWDAWLIAGGAAVFMAGSALFRRVTTGRVAR
jgi:hypothetical protein